MGANTSNLTIMLSLEYFILLLIANVLAIPALLSGGASWLDNYAFRIGHRHGGSFLSSGDMRRLHFRIKNNGVEISCPVFIYIDIPHGSHCPQVRQPFSLLRLCIGFEIEEE